MIILLPTTSEQTISIMPRYSSCVDIESYISRVGESNIEAEECLIDAVDEFNNVSIYLRRDGDGKTETITNVATRLNGNYVDYIFSSEILEEGSTYFMEITESGSLAYRDKIYSTSQGDYTVKHEVSKPRYIQPTGEVNDNTYII